jgi:hypothetical protein
MAMLLRNVVLIVMTAQFCQESCQISGNEDENYGNFCVEGQSDIGLGGSMNSTKFTGLQHKLCVVGGPQCRWSSA